MGINTNERRSFPPNMIRLCIDQYDDDIKGRMYSKMDAEPLRFENCCEMLLKADAMFDQYGYPQSFFDKKNFIEGREKGRYVSPKALQSDEMMNSQEGKLCTLDVLIRSRRQASWQGIVKTINGSPPEKFQSGMELLGCIQKIMQTNDYIRNKEQLKKEEMK